MRQTLEMCAVDIYMVRKNNLHKGDLLKPPKQPYIHDAIIDMGKYDIFPILQRGQKRLKKIHGMGFKVCDYNVQYERRLRN